MDEVDATSNVGSIGSSRRWRLCGNKCPKAEIVFLCQVVILYTVIAVSIYNLMQGRRDSNLWTALLSSCLGYLLPNNSRKRDGIARFLPDAA